MPWRVILFLAARDRHAASALPAQALTLAARETLRSASPRGGGVNSRVGGTTLPQRFTGDPKARVSRRLCRCEAEPSKGHGRSRAWVRDRSAATPRVGSATCSARLLRKRRSRAG